MNFSVALLCLSGLVALASCQLHHNGQYTGGLGSSFRNRNRGPHHDGPSRFGNPHRKPVVHHKQPVVHPIVHKQPVVHPIVHKQPVVHHKQPVVHPDPLKPVVHKEKAYSAVIDVNHLNGKLYDASQYWQVDCNAIGTDYTTYGSFPHKAITGIWDDKNNFNDLDKIKCSSLPSDVTLDLHDYIELIEFNAGKYSLCPPDYVLTAVSDQAFGFPNVSWGKCNKLLYGSLDNKNRQDKYTEGQAGGYYGPYKHWNVQCPEGYVAAGLEKHGRRIKTLTCVYLIPHH